MLLDKKIQPLTFAEPYITAQSFQAAPFVVQTYRFIHVVSIAAAMMVIKFVLIFLCLLFSV